MLKRLFLIALLLLLAVLAWEFLTFPDTAKLATENPTTTAFMEQRKKELREAGKSDDTLLYTFVPYARISPYLRRAVLVAEDNDFYEHQGVDVKAMKEAIRRDWEHRKITHGGSTITQQLAKNLYLSSSRNPLRKVKEYFIARSLERHLTKKRILELYLNVVEMGDRIYGAEAASQAYFRRHASALTPQQAALLAGCLPNPRVMVPGEPNKRLRARQRMILSRMRRWGYLMEEEVLTEKKPATPAAPATATVDTALQQTPPTDTATPATPPPPAATDTTATTATDTDTAAPPPAAATDTSDTSATAAKPPSS